MSKYINAEELKETFMKGDFDLTYHWDYVKMIIDEMPGVEIIRCKDCKKYKPYGYPYLCGECGNCSYDFPAKIVAENGYCNEGEMFESEVNI